MSMRRVRMSVKGAALYGPYALLDSLRNRHCRGTKRRFLILRHSAKNPHFHDYLLNWLEAELPSVSALFEQRLLPFYGADWPRYLVCAPWLQDPAEDWLPRGSWKRLLQIEQSCAQRGIPVINPAQNLSRATKSTGSRIISQLGVRVPRALPVADPETFCPDAHGLRFPLIIREDRKHSAPTCLVKNTAQLREVPWSRFSCPVAAEFIDVRSPHDGFYRKYRYVAARDYGVPRHLIVSHHWEVHAAQREHNRFTKEEEIAYLEQPDVNHDTLQRVRRTLRLDLVAFDYSYAPDGQLVVWEANPYPNLSHPTRTGMEYTAQYVARSFAAIAAMYLTAGQLELPPYMVELLGTCAPAEARPEAA
jgi:hypothetical protein